MARRALPSAPFVFLPAPESAPLKVISGGGENRFDRDVIA